MQKDGGADSSRASRKRAPNACLACRARKVRCDVSLREGRCTNCLLDGTECRVKARPTRYRTAGRRIPGQPEGILQGPSADVTSSRRGSEETINHVVSNRRQSPELEQQRLLSALMTRRNHPLGDATTRPQCDGDFAKCSDPSSPAASMSSGDIMPGDNLPLRPLRPAPSAHADKGAGLHSHVIYQCFPFLRADLSLVSEEDVDFLDTKGCFRLPPRQVLDDFVRQYFLHVHPGLPLLDEAMFWEAYHQTSAYVAQGRPSLSLFVFQAMLFASCSYVDVATVQKLGFKSILTARAAYYRRAKLLFDFGAELDPIANAQGALLLSFNASMRDRKRTNSLWLAVGINLARGVGAHRAHETPDDQPDTMRTLKRLWWCCVVRDRILALGVRRRLQISLEDFDPALMVLTEEDFSHEVCSSRVYDADAKVTLILFYIMLCDLVVSLTGVLEIVYPARDVITPQSSSARFQQCLDGVRSCKRSLQSWFERATVRFPTPGAIASSNESVILHTNLMYIYYHSARLALYQHEALLLTACPFGIQDAEQGLLQSRVNLEDASSGVTENLREIMIRKMGQYLPISIVAYAALPLVFHMLDVNLSKSPSQSAQKRGRLSVYIEAMKGFQYRYDGTEDVLNFVNTVVRYTSSGPAGQESIRLLLDNDHPADPSLSAPEMSLARPTAVAKMASDWGHLLLQEPRLYFRVSHTIDLSLCLGRPPEEAEFPVLSRATRISTRTISVGNLQAEHRIGLGSATAKMGERSHKGAFEDATAYPEPGDWYMGDLATPMRGDLDVALNQIDCGSTGFDMLMFEGFNESSVGDGWPPAV